MRARVLRIAAGAALMLRIVTLTARSIAAGAWALRTATWAGVRTARHAALRTIALRARSERTSRIRPCILAGTARRVIAPESTTGFVRAARAGTSLIRTL